MIFGKTVERLETEEKEAVKSRIFGTKKFAWFPETLHDGRQIWLGFYYEFYEGRFDGFRYTVYHHTEPSRYLSLDVSNVKIQVSYDYKHKLNDAEIARQFNEHHNKRG